MFDEKSALCGDNKSFSSGISHNLLHILGVPCLNVNKAGRWNLRQHFELCFAGLPSLNLSG